MSSGASDLDIDPSYIAGLLDAVARIRFDLSEQPDGTFTVRPMLRIKPYETAMREAIIGNFLESQGYQYDLVERHHGDGFFQLQQRSDLEDLQAYLGGISAQVVRELAFANGPFAEEFDFDILDPEDAYRFLRTRDELRFGWHPRGRHHWRTGDLLERSEVREQDISTPSLPHGEIRGDYTIEWIAGVFDGIGRYRPSIARSREHAIDYSMYPVARLYRGGVHPVFVENVRRFCDDYDLTYGDSSESTTLNVVFTGPKAIHGVLNVVFPRLIALAEASAAMRQEILPRFEAEEDHTEQGFYRLLCDFDPVAAASGGPFRHREYTPDYFEDVWQDEL